MSKRVTYLIILVILILFLVIIIMSYNKIKSNKFLNDIERILEEDNVQKSDKEEIEISFDYKDNNEIIGMVKIDKINFEGVVYNGTTLDLLDKGVGHFLNTPLFDGNVALAAHNSNKFWAKLKKLNNGDKIIYKTLLGTREYEVFSSKQIDSNDWSSLEDTEDNIITLITCVKGKSNLRLCVQAKEI